MDKKLIRSAVKTTFNFRTSSPGPPCDSPACPTVPQSAMAAAAQDVFEEHLGVIAALKDNYTRKDDALTVADVNSLKEEVVRVCAAREDEVKEAIKGEFRGWLVGCNRVQEALGPLLFNP